MLRNIIRLVCALLLGSSSYAQQSSSFVSLNPDGTLTYSPDAKGNTIPDFSGVGYRHGDRDLPNVPVVKTVTPAASGSSQQIIQNAIDEVALMPINGNGFRGAILFKAGTYNIEGTIHVRASGIVLRGEGSNEGGTKWVATGTGQRTLLSIAGSGSRTENTASRVFITDGFVPTGVFSFNVTSAESYKVGDNIIVTRPGTDEWIHDLKMDAMANVPPERQWQATDYDLYYEREITRIDGNKIYIDNPIVMEMESKYGGGYISKYTFSGRITDVGVEDICFESEYVSDTDEDHGWTAVSFSVVQNGWAKNIISRYFGYSCVTMNSNAKYITVKDSKCLDAKSQITGSRRYSFNINGRSQLNLITGCETTEGRHDYVTGAKSAGPNVFHNSTAVNTHSDTGPHHRWASGTLYDNIVSDGTINVQDRGAGGTADDGGGNGHGWTGVTQVLWNCTANKVAVQSPWVPGKNYAIAVKGQKTTGSLSGRPNGEWELQNQQVTPSSLYEAQLSARKANLPPVAVFTSFTGKLGSSDITLDWTTGNEYAIDHFELMHATDNVNFNTIYTAAPTNSITGGSYNYIHTEYSTAYNYYKIKVVGTNGVETLSQVVTIAGNLANEIGAWNATETQWAYDFAGGQSLPTAVSGVTVTADKLYADGTNTDIITSTSNGLTNDNGWLPKPTAAIGFVRISSVITTGYELQGLGNGQNALKVTLAGTGTSPNKLAVYDIANALSIAKYAMRLNFSFIGQSPMGGSLRLILGNRNGSTSSTFTNASNVATATTTNYFGGLRWQYSSSGIEFGYRKKTSSADAVWTPISTTLFDKNGGDYDLELYANNSSAIQYYTKGGQIYGVASKAIHIWVNSILVNVNSSPNIVFNTSSTAELPVGSVINAFLFNHIAFTPEGSAQLTISNLKASYAQQQTTLPVTLTSFSAKKEYNAVQLKWTTASEQNNAYFEIMRSADGKKFDKIGKIAGTGTSNRLNYYIYTDQFPYKGYNYYKLRQIDVNNTVEETPPIVIKLVEAQAISVYQHENLVYVQVNATTEGSYLIEATDILGRIINRHKVYFMKGINQIDINSGNMLTNGVYLVKVTSENETTAVKFIKR